MPPPMGMGGHLFRGLGGPHEEQSGGRLHWKRLLGYLAPRWPLVVVALFLSLSITGLSLVPPRLIGLVIDRAIVSKNLQSLMWLTFLLFLAYGLEHGLTGVKGWLLGKLGQTVIFELWQDVYHNLLRLSFDFYDANQTGNIMSRVTTDVGAVERVIVEGVDMLVVASLTLLGVTGILFFINWKLALITLIPIPLLLFVAWLATERMHRVYRDVRRKMGEVSALLQDSLSGIREIKSFAREDYELERLCVRSMDYLSSNLEAIKLWSFFSPTIMSLTSLGSFLVLLFGGRIAILSGTLTPGQIVSFLFYVGPFYQPIQRLNWFNHMLQHARASSERIFELIDAVPRVKEREKPVVLPHPIRGEVVYREVHFSYENGREVLHGISLEARPGEIVALVGPTGAGKTTIVRLLPRFYDVDSGNILVDGVDIRELSLKQLRQSIGIVMQEPFLFNGTVLENIAYGKPGATMEEIVEAARLANAHQFISAFPEGYDQQIGERGIRLSVGEKQRIAIARALLKNPPILILDEATSSVDNQTEKLIQEAIEHLLQSRTSFVIAHRLSTVRHAHKILVVEHGQIVESGRHEELVAAGGLYARLYHSQWRLTEKITKVAPTGF
ncbi:MAG TPA: ABC transporter ATP-binding protein, partial [bacterium]|nr:ABC transporter ATP-binding protein [bacterium]